MERLQELTTFLLVIIPIGGVGRISYCAWAGHVNPDEATSYKVRAKNIAIFMALAETITGLLKIILNYF